MVEPGLVVHALGDLVEQHEVLRAQIELPGGAAKVEALVLAQAALGILAPVPLALAARRGDFQLERWFAARARPDQRLVGLQLYRRAHVRRPSGPIARSLADNLRRRCEHLK